MTGASLIRGDSIWSSGHAKKTNERTWLERQGALPLAGG